MLYVRILLRQACPALVILDLWLVKRDDGWAFLTRLWDDAETTHIPAIIVTGKPGLPPIAGHASSTRHRQWW